MATLREGENKVAFRRLSDTDNEEMSENTRDGSRKILPWDGFSEWFHCFCVVTFDLELGQALEVSAKNILTGALTMCRL